jgi:hypothetical protein
MLRIPRCLEIRLTYGYEVVSLTHRLRFIAQKPFFFMFLVLISVRGSVNLKDLVRLEILGKLKQNSLTFSGLQPATFRYVPTTLPLAPHRVPRDI